MVIKLHLIPGLQATSVFFTFVRIRILPAALKHAVLNSIVQETYYFTLATLDVK
jgi:hypothetical protein